jgi:hypothetical protein
MANRPALGVNSQKEPHLVSFFLKVILSVATLSKNVSFKMKIEDLNKNG